MNLWVDLSDVPLKRRLPYLRAIRDAGGRFVVPAGDGDATREGALVRDGDALRDGKREVARLHTLRSPGDQDAAAAAEGTVVVQATDWTIIPLENLIAARRDRPGTLFARAGGADEALLFLDILETGVHGILLCPDGPGDVRRVADRMRGKEPTPDETREACPSLVAATVTTVEDAGVADRVCLDATTAFAEGEGLLIGSTARSLCLVLAETADAGYVAPRPFRVNAGALHAYTLGDGGRTLYLSEADAGQRLTAMRRDGATRTATLGRAKIERRPSLLVRWDVDGRPGHAVLQRAETVRLSRPDGSAVAVTDLRAGERILVHEETVARHFGMPIDETLEER